MDAKFLIPVLPHVLKYLQKHYGQIMAISSRGPAPTMLLGLLTKHDKLDPSKVRPSQKLIDNKIYFPYPVYVGANILKTRGAYITPGNLERFNDAIDDLIREQMFHYVSHPNAPFKEVDYNIRHFQEINGFTEDDLPFDNLKRWYYRERQRFADRLNFVPKREPQLVLSF
jgi:hypothetical protein